MADDLYKRLLKLRDASFDLTIKNRLLNFSPKARFQTPLLPENGIVFFEHWSSKNVSIPLSIFAPLSETFSEENQADLISDFKYALSSVEEATGEQNLFLSLGFLRWQNTSPVLLIPVKIDPKTLVISLSDIPPIENVPLRLNCKGTIKLPQARDFQNGKIFDIRNYFAEVQKAAETVTNWKFTPKGMSLGFFDAAKLYSQADIDSEEWKSDPKINNHPVLSRLLSQEGFRVLESGFEDKDLDDFFNPTEHHFIKPLDSSATLALLEALQPENEAFVVQAPPGSNREDFLADLISENIANRKRILLTYKKKATLERFNQVWNPALPEYKDITWEKAKESLQKTRQELVQYNKAVNKPILPGGGTLSASLIAIADSSSYKKTLPDSIFSGVENLDAEKFHEACGLLLDLLELASRNNAKKAKQAFKGSSLTFTDEIQKKRIHDKLEKASKEFKILSMLSKAAAKTFLFDRAIDINVLTEVSEAITSDFGEKTPSFENWNLQSRDWTTYEESLKSLSDAGASWSEFRRNGSEIYTDEAIDESICDAREILADNLERTFKSFSEYYRDAQRTLLHTLKTPKKIKSDKELLDITDKLIEIQEHKKLYKNTSVLANHLCGKDWKYEHTNWTALASKIRWFYSFREKVQNNKNAPLSYAILERYNELRNVITDAETLKKLCHSAAEDFADLKKELGFETIEDPSVEAQADLVEKWERSQALIPLYALIQEKERALFNLGLTNLAEAALDESNKDKDINVELLRFWHSLQVQNVCKISPSIFTYSPKVRANKSREYREQMDDFCMMNLRLAKELLQKSPVLLTILSLEATALRIPRKENLFDVVIFLDAESISPLQAMPAILRSKRAIFIGDSSLPPVPFPILQSASHRDSFVAPHLENILSFSLYKGAKLSFLPLNTLHKHPALIDFANVNFYGQKIHKLSLPSSEPFCDMQIKMETQLSKAIAEAAVKHVEQHPTQSLGIIVFTEERRRDVFKAIEEVVKEHPDLGLFLSPKNILRDPYIKLPEEAAGDFRDTIFVCAEMNAALAQQGLGSKMINVCATHALSKLWVFTAEPIETSSSTNPGIRTYWNFLKYVKDAKNQNIFGKSALLSPFEEHVLKALSGKNLSIETKWGYRDTTIQFAVRDANNPEQFLIGIETDSSEGALRSSVEDREYIRPMILSRLGWKIIRLWCPNWFKTPVDERDHILTTIAVEQSVAPPPKRTNEEKENLPAIHVEPYRILHPKIEDSVHDVPIPELPIKYLILQMKFYVDAESPIHEKSLIRRILELHRVHRAGPAVIRAIEDAFAQGINRKAFIKTGHFFYSTQPSEIVLRNRAALPDEERKLTFVPPEERELFPSGTDEATIKQTLGLL